LPGSESIRAMQRTDRGIVSSMKAMEARLLGRFKGWTARDVGELAFDDGNKIMSAHLYAKDHPLLQVEGMRSFVHETLKAVDGWSAFDGMSEEIGRAHV